LVANSWRLSAALLASLTAAALTPAVAAQPAAAAGCAPVIDKVTVRDVVLQQTSTASTTTTVAAHDPCSTDPSVKPRITRVTGQAFLSDGSWWDLTYRASGSSWSGASGARFGARSALGRGQQVVEVTDAEGNTTYRDTLPFYVRRNVTVTSMDASPEPVRKGSYVTVAAVVKRLTVSSSGARSYVAYAGHGVGVYFRPLTSSSYTKVGSTTTSSTGRVSARFKATVDGCWKVQSTQTSQHVLAWSGADCVDVR
jgi:hypothetical protein